MTALLVVVTLASLALAGALLVYVLKLSREERDRSEARAAALAELLEAQAPVEPPQPRDPELSPHVGPQAAFALEAAARPLELVTLRHQRQGDTLVITGLVRNPPDAMAINGLVAVAFAFDKQG